MERWYVGATGPGPCPPVQISVAATAGAGLGWTPARVRFRAFGWRQRAAGSGRRTLWRLVSVGTYSTLIRW